MSLVAPWIERWMGSPFNPQSVLRGSQITALWVPGRPAYDVDLLLLDRDWAPQALAQRLEALARECGGGGAVRRRSRPIGPLDLRRSG